MSPTAEKPDPTHDRSAQTALAITDSSLASSSQEPSDSTNSVAEIDHIVGHWSDLRQEGKEREAQVESERNRFLTDFSDLTDSVIRPAMQAAVDRLAEDGGGGLIEERKEDLTHRPRITLWMSLEDGITGTPRQDLNPYLQLDADVGLRRIDVWEGDMWQKEVNSRATSPWELNDVSAERITERILKILRRAATHGVEEAAALGSPR